MTAGLPTAVDAFGSVRGGGNRSSKSRDVVRSDRAGRVFKSTDGAETWNAADSALPSFPDGKAHVCAIAVDPQSSSTLYAGTSGGKVFKTADGGANWVDTGLRPGGGCAGTLAIDPRNSDTVFAVVTFLIQSAKRMASGNYTRAPMAE